MVGSLVIWLALSTAPAAAPLPESVVMDWDANVVRVRGVGAPRILSPTGHLHDGDPVEAARQNMADCLRAGVERPKHLSDAEWTAWLKALGARLVSGTPRRFSDGSVWLDASARIEPRLSGEVTALIAPEGTTRVVALEIVDTGGRRCGVGAGGAIPLVWRSGVAGAPAGAIRTSRVAAALAVAADGPALSCDSLRGVEVYVP